MNPIFCKTLLNPQGYGLEIGNPFPVKSKEWMKDFCYQIFPIYPEVVGYTCVKVEIQDLNVNDEESKKCFVSHLHYKLLDADFVEPTIITLYCRVEPELEEQDINKIKLPDNFVRMSKLKEERAALMQEACEKYMTSQGKDELYYDVLKMVAETKVASATMIRRKFGVGYPRAATILDQMERDGFVSDCGAHGRTVYVTVEDVENLKKKTKM